MGIILLSLNLNVNLGEIEQICKYLLFLCLQPYSAYTPAIYYILPPAISLAIAINSSIVTVIYTVLHVVAAIKYHRGAMLAWLILTSIQMHLELAFIIFWGILGGFQDQDPLVIGSTIILIIKLATRAATFIASLSFYQNIKSEDMGVK